MKEKIGSHTIERFESISELPVDRFMKFNLYMMIDAGVGSDQSSIDTHDKNLIRLIMQGKKDQAVKVLQNRNQAQRMVLEQISPRFLAFWALVYKVDDKPFDDYSKSNCEEMVRLSSDWGASVSWYKEITTRLKKNFADELDVLSPERTDSPLSKEVFSKRKSRVLLCLKNLQSQIEDFEEKIEGIDRFLFGMVSTDVFAGPDGVEARYLRNYEDMSFILSQNSSRNPKEMSTLEYFTSWRILKKQFKSK